MEAVPAVTACTSPVLDTVATAELELDHVITRPVSTLPLASFVTALACVFCPIVRLGEFNVTATVATGTSVTVTGAEPAMPSLVAVIVAVPATSAVTSPDALTDAVVAALLDQVTVRPVSTFPLASFNVAVA